ncbi:MAG: hypothetical protein GXP27_13505 [Planctomycetes bacterium]|nr:hypothetical protein [Planctomycetota bacterium]
MAHDPGGEQVGIVGYTMNWDSGPVKQPTHSYPKKVFKCVEFNVPIDNRCTPTWHHARLRLRSEVPLDVGRSAVRLVLDERGPAERSVQT